MNLVFVIADTFVPGKRLAQAYSTEADAALPGRALDDERARSGRLTPLPPPTDPADARIDEIDAAEERAEWEANQDRDD